MPKGRPVVILFLKAPLVGGVKTRLAADIGALAAWRFYCETAQRVVGRLAPSPRMGSRACRSAPPLGPASAARAAAPCRPARHRAGRRRHRRAHGALPRPSGAAPASARRGGHSRHHDRDYRAVIRPPPPVRFPVRPGAGRRLLAGRSARTGSAVRGCSTGCPGPATGPSRRPWPTSPATNAPHSPRRWRMSTTARPSGTWQQRQFAG